MIGSHIHLVADGAHILPLVPLLHVVDTQDTALLSDTSEGTVDGEGEAIVSLFHAREGVGGGIQLTSESDRSTR